MGIFQSKPRFSLGMTGDNYQPENLMEIYNRVKARKLAEQIADLEEAEKEREELEKQ